jgi:predicted RNA-binding protein with PIN domain
VLDEDDPFRSRVADEAGRLGESAMGRASWLFLIRPEGWREEFDLLVQDATVAAERAGAAHEERSAARRLTQVEEALGRARSEVLAAEGRRERAEAQLTEERDRRVGAERQAVGLRSERDAVDRRRADAVRDLAAARELAEERLQDLRLLRERLAVAEGTVARLEDDLAALRSVPPPAERAGVDAAGPPVPPGVAGAVAGAAAAASELAARLAEVADALEPATGQDAAAPSVGSDAVAAVGPQTVPSASRPSGRVRRRPPTLGRGAIEGTPEATRQYLSLPNVVVVVDGYNVTMQGWPALDHAGQRDGLIAMAGSLGARTGAEFRLVFDGVDEGGVPAVQAPLPVRVVFSPGDREADDVVLDLVEAVPVDRPVVVVSSDRRVRDGARARGAAVVASGELLELGRS